MNFSLKRLRIDTGENKEAQTELAEKTGLSRSSISEIENGRNSSIGLLITISRALDLNVFLMKKRTR